MKKEWWWWWYGVPLCTMRAERPDYRYRPKIHYDLTFWLNVNSLRHSLTFLNIWTSTWGMWRKFKNCFSVVIYVRMLSHSNSSSDSVMLQDFTSIITHTFQTSILVCVFIHLSELTSL